MVHKWLISTMGWFDSTNRYKKINYEKGVDSEGERALTQRFTLRNFIRSVSLKVCEAHICCPKG